jgi:uncharacterized protein YkwD
MRRALAVTCLFVCFAAGAVAAGQGEAKKAKGKDPNLEKDEKKLTELTNQERKKHDLPPLKVSPLLTKVARAHAENMARQEKLEHILDGKTPFQRLKAANYLYKHAGENVAFRLNVELPEIIENWMKSPLHRKNVLGKDYTEIGIGAAIARDGTIYYTQVFGTPKEEKKD